MQIKILFLAHRLEAKEQKTRTKLNKSNKTSPKKPSESIFVHKLTKQNLDQPKIIST
jgi:hypothetical protein